MRKKLLCGKILPIALCLGILVSVSAFSATADTETGTTPSVVWDGTVATEFAGGTGTKADPYLISTAEQLAYLVQITTTEDAFGNTVNKYYKLTADIYLNDITGNEWYEAGGVHSWLGTTGSFSGKLNGSGHVIYGIYINYDNDNTINKAGLFSQVCGGAEITDLGIEYSYIKAKTHAGALSGDRNWGSVKIERCYSSNTVILSTGLFSTDKEATESSERTYVGGLCAAAPGNGAAYSFTDCYSSAQLGVAKFKGGLTGSTYVGTGSGSVTFTRCFSTQENTRLTSEYYAAATYSGCYARRCTADWDGTEYTKIYVPELTMDQMQGSAAKTYMPEFFAEGTCWKTVLKNGTPTFLRAAERIDSHTGAYVQGTGNDSYAKGTLCFGADFMSLKKYFTDNSVTGEVEAGFLLSTEKKLAGSDLDFAAVTAKKAVNVKTNVSADELSDNLYCILKVPASLKDDGTNTAKDAYLNSNQYARAYVKYTGADGEEKVILADTASAVAKDLLQ